MENYEYLQKLSDRELIQIINAMIDFKEVSEAFMILENRDLDKVLELGIQIIEQDKGDEYLQASIWDFLFFENPYRLIDAIEHRKNKMGKVLLEDVIADLTDTQIRVSEDLWDRIKRELDQAKSMREDKICHV